MYPLYFYVCLVASTASLVILVLLAIFPVKLPLVPKTTKAPQATVRQRKARSPTRKAPVVSYWDTWDDDNEDL